MCKNGLRFEIDYLFIVSAIYKISIFKGENTPLYPFRSLYVYYVRIDFKTDLHYDAGLNVYRLEDC